MTNSAMRLFVRSIIAEAKVTDKKVKKTKKAMRTSVDDRLKMIDEAGDKAALQAKIAKIEEDIKEANEIKNAIPSNISHFVDREIIGDLMDDLAASIEELQAKKTELEEQMKGLDEASAKSTSGMTKKKDKPKAPSHKETSANQVYESRFKKVAPKKIKEAIFSSNDVTNILKSAQNALNNGQTVTVDGKAISKVVPAAGAFFPTDGGPSLRITNYLGNMGAIKIDGVPANLEPSTSQMNTSTPLSKTDFEDRFGRSGGVQTAFGKYTGD
jgi:hypothetical protein